MRRNYGPSYRFSVISDLNPTVVANKSTFEAEMKSSKIKAIALLQYSFNADYYEVAARLQFKSIFKRPWARWFFPWC